MSKHQFDHYPELLAHMQGRVNNALTRGGQKLFCTDSSGLFDAYLAAIPAQQRQKYNCNCCRHFVNHFGGLVSITDVGNTESAVWGDAAPGLHQAGVSQMLAMVLTSRVTGVFIPARAALGQPEAGGFDHMHVQLPAALCHTDRTKTAGQAMAEKREDFRTMSRALAEFTPHHVSEAVRVLRSDKLYAAHHVLAAGEFLHHLHGDRAAVASSLARDNILWSAIARAPAGFCHPRSSMIGTLLEDIAAGLSFDAVSRRFADKMHPLRYQRPVAPPKAGNIAQAERAFEQLGLAPALQRRLARVDEVPLLWTPEEKKPAASTSGLFGHLAPKASAPTGMHLRAGTITLEKFVQKVVPTAIGIEALLGSYIKPIFITAPVNSDAPKLFQWDHPFSHYCWNGGVTPTAIGLSQGFAKVVGITRLPARWGDDADKFQHHGDGLVLLLAGACETRDAGAALFPAQMRSELHGVRATIEAYSRGARMAGLNESAAIGLDLRAGSGAYPVTVRVTTGSGTQDYVIDRWE